MNEDELRSLFREIREEPVPADSLVRVRSGVAACLDRRRTWRRLVPLFLATAVVTAMLALVLMRPSQPVPAPAPPPLVAAVQEPLPRIDVPPPPVRRMVHRPPRLRPPSSSLAGTVVRIETNDPSVVIVLVGE